MNVLLAPVISEKATFIADKHEQVIFRVVQDATKPESRPRSSSCSRCRSRACRSRTCTQGKALRPLTGRRRNWKKAYVCLKPGQEINFAQEA